MSPHRARTMRALRWRLAIATGALLGVGALLVADATWWEPQPESLIVCYSHDTCQTLTHRSTP